MTLTFLPKQPKGPRKTVLLMARPVKPTLQGASLHWDVQDVRGQQSQLSFNPPTLVKYKTQPRDLHKVRGNPMALGDDYRGRLQCCLRGGRDASHLKGLP